MTADDRDPVEAALGEKTDRYDVATWDVRTVFDVVAVRVYLALRALRSSLLIAVLVRKLSRYRAYYRAATGVGSDVAGRRGW